MVLVYPFFGHEQIKSDFRYPPLGLGYLASSLENHDITVTIVDCTFIDFETAINQILEKSPRIVGIYTMVTLERNAIAIAKRIRPHVDFLIAGGPLASLAPHDFLPLFDVVVRGEGELTLLELVKTNPSRVNWDDIGSIVYRKSNGITEVTPQRELVSDLDLLSPPARRLFPNRLYKKYWKRNFGFSATNQLTTRGCPFSCDFCSSPVFGKSYREVSPENVVDEMLQIQDLGYDRVFFSDDCFTLNPNRVKKICSLLIEGRNDIDWMCLSRVDRLDSTLAKAMSDAGCVRIYFGIESGNNEILKLMSKNTNLVSVKQAVKIAAEHNMETGGFFILGYPGETTESLLDTVNLSSNLGLDYVSYSYPYPIPGTGLYDKALKFNLFSVSSGTSNLLPRHTLRLKTGISQRKLNYARIKGETQHYLRKKGILGSSFAHVFEIITTEFLKLLR